MMDLFHMGGFGMYPTSIFGLLLVAASVAYARSPERRFVPLQVSLGILTMASGDLGFVIGMVKSAMFLERVAHDQRWILAVGMGESLTNVALALALVVLAAMAASFGALRLAREAPVAAGSLA